MANVYAKDSLVRVSSEFTVSSTDTDPTTVKCIYKDPNNSVTTLVYGTDSALVRDATGKYHVDIPATIAGNWWYRFEASGTVTAANEAEFVVSLSQIL
jgi:hypothetical protein